MDMFDGKEYIYAVYEEKSFSKAAQKLYITQPALSTAVKKVETRLGRPIFDRSTSPVRLTECGEKYIHYAEHLMDMENEFENYCNFRTYSDFPEFKSACGPIAITNLMETIGSYNDYPQITNRSYQEIFNLVVN